LLRSALGAVPFTLTAGRWSDQLALPRPHRRGTIPLILTVVRAEGITALVATHDEALIDLADEVLTLEDGHIVT
jgi:putative ABC transport system ATP-binding protein